MIFGGKKDSRPTDWRFFCPPGGQETIFYLRVAWVGVQVGRCVCVGGGGVLVGCVLSPSPLPAPLLLQTFYPTHVLCPALRKHVLPSEMDRHQLPGEYKPGE